MHSLLVLLQGSPFELLLWLMPFEVFVGQTDLPVLRNNVEMGSAFHS